MQRPVLLFFGLFLLLVVSSPLYAREGVHITPPVLHTPEDLHFLREGIHTLLQSQMENNGRLAASPEDAAFELRSTLTAFGGSMVTDLVLIRLPDNDVALSQRHSTKDAGEVLPSITTFGSSVLTFLKKPDGDFEKNSSPAPPRSMRVTRISPPRKGALVSMDSGDLTGSGGLEIVLGDRREIRVQDMALEKDLALFSLPHEEQLLRLDVLDTNADGRAEIWITATNTRTQRMCSRVLILDNTELRVVAGPENRFFAKGRTREGLPVLLTRMRGFRETFFSGDTAEARITEKGIVFQASDPPQETLFERLPVRTRTSDMQETLFLKENGTLSLVSPTEGVLWESREAYAGLPTFLEYVPDQNRVENPAIRYYFPGRIRILPRKGGTESLLIARNIESSGGLFQRIRMFRTASLHLLGWNDFGLESLAASMELDGYIADFIVLPEQGEPSLKILIGLVKGGGNLSLSPETRFVTCTLSP